MAKMTKLLVMLLVLQQIISGCADQGTRFEVEGEIKRIDHERKILYIDGFEVRTKKVEAYRKGDIKAVLSSPYRDKDVYVPDKTTTISIEKVSK